MTYPNQLFSASAFIGFILCAIPLYWHLVAWNVGTSLYIAWAGLGCLNLFINSVVWNSSVQNFAPVWCDISTRFIIGFIAGMPAALLVIAHRLFKIASNTFPITTRAEKRRAVLIDLAIGLGIPLVQMPLQLVVEGHRFDILEEIGCYPNTFNVTLAFPLVYIWPLVISFIAAIYSAFTIRLFWKSSQHLKELSGSSKSPNKNPYMRLIVLSSIQLLFNLPMSIYLFYFNAHALSVSPWISWDDTHANYSFVGQLHSAAWRLHAESIVEWNRWSVVLSAFLFFACFGFAEEARKHYRLAYSFVGRRLHLGNFGTKRASSSPRSSDTSFGGIKKGLATILSFKNAFSPLGSRRGPVSTMESKTLSSVSEYRLTSDDSVFEGVDAQLKALGVVPENPTQTTVITLPRHLPVSPPPVLFLSLPPNRLNSPLPHRPVSSSLDLSEKV